MRLPFKRNLRLETLESRRLLVASVDIPDNLQAEPGSEVTAIVQVQQSAGTRAAEIHLSFDPQVLTLTESNVAAGTVWGTGAQVVANVDQSAGTLTVFVFAAEGFSGGTGSLLEMRFGVRTTAVVGSTTVLDLSKVELNEGQIAISPAPQSGADATDGLITIVSGAVTGSGRISGFVFADANQNNVRDSSEGIPGVTIELVNSAGAVLTTTTDRQGSYSFENVAAGNFTIREIQPNAYIDGGTNSRSVTLTAQQSLTEQNFRELGLKPEYVFNQLLTTPVQPAGSTKWIDVLTEIQAAAGSSPVMPTTQNQLTRQFFASSNPTPLTTQPDASILVQQSILPEFKGAALTENAADQMTAAVDLTPNLSSDTEASELNSNALTLAVSPPLQSIVMSMLGSSRQDELATTLNSHDFADATTPSLTSPPLNLDAPLNHPSLATDTQPKTNIASSNTAIDAAFASFENEVVLDALDLRTFLSSH
jgi:hypothetical protein